MLNTPEEPQDAMVVLIRAGARRQAQVIQELEKGDSHSGATPTEIQQEPTTSETEPADTEPVDVTDSTDALPFTFDDKLFVSARPRECKSRRAKREERHAHSDKACQTWTRQQLQELQEKDESLAPLRGLIKSQSDAQKGDFYVRDGLLYRKWLPPGRSERDDGRAAGIT